MSDGFRLRFVGRFVFACNGNENAAKRVTVLGMDMSFNADLPCCRHRLFLTAQRSSVETVGRRAADLSVFGISDKGGAEDQLLVWDLEGFDLKISNAASGKIKLEQFEWMPDIGKLAKRHFDKAWLGNLPSPSPVSFRMAFESGDFTADQFDTQKRVVFKRLGDEPDDNADPDRYLPDIVHVEVEADGPMVLDLTRRRDGARSSIVIMPADFENSPYPCLTISNLCVEGGSDEDREFAAYYDVLEKAPHPLDRLVPYSVEGRQLGAKADCGGKSAAYY